MILFLEDKKKCELCRINLNHIVSYSTFDITRGFTCVLNSLKSFVHYSDSDEAYAKLKSLLNQFELSQNYDTMDQ